MCYNTSCSAGVAHPVERHLAKVEVASSSLVTRSIKKSPKGGFFFCVHSCYVPRMNKLKMQLLLADTCIKIRFKRRE